MGQGLIVALVTTVLGCSGMFATSRLAASGYLVEIGNKRIWMDAGAGTWRHLLERMHYADLDGIILSHRHPDHVTDLFQAYHARRYGGPEPLDPIPLWAPQETIDRITAFIAELDVSFDMHAVRAGDSFDYDGARIAFFSMVHPAETVGVRIERDGVVVAYSADTGPDGDLEALAAGADVFLCEATFQDADRGWTGHMSASQAGTAAARAEAAKLVLTHLRPGLDVALSIEEARRTAEGVEVELAADGQRLEISA